MSLVSPSVVLFIVILHTVLCFLPQVSRKNCWSIAKSLFLLPFTPFSASALEATPNTIMSPEELNSKIQTVLLLHKNGKVQEAIEGYRDVIPVSAPQIQLSLYGNLGALLMSQGDYEGARECFESSLSISPKHASAQYNLAVLLTSKFNEHAKALKHCALAIRADPNSHKAFHLMGNIMQSLGKHAEATKYFEQAEALALQLEGSASSSPLVDKTSTNNAKQSLLSLKSLLNYNYKKGDVIEHMVENRLYRMHCLSVQPLLFLVEDLITAEECQQITAKASSLLEKSFIMGSAENTEQCSGDSQIDYNRMYRSSYNAWLPTDSLLDKVQEKLSTLLNLPLAFIKHKSEDLQVVKYDLGGQFKAHQDSSTFHSRFLTALLYLNTLPVGYAGGETWFPFANSDLSADISMEEAVSQALSLYEERDQSNFLPGLKVQPKAGSAVFFFNYDINTNKLDPHAVHAGLPVYKADSQIDDDEKEVEKWIANYWIENDVNLLADLLQSESKSDST